MQQVRTVYGRRRLDENITKLYSIIYVCTYYDFTVIILLLLYTLLYTILLKILTSRFIKCVLADDRFEHIVIAKMVVCR